MRALLNEQVKRILLVRPAVEAGERLGFLPGDLSQKVDPYLRPLYDALYEMLGFETVNNISNGTSLKSRPAPLFAAARSITRSSFWTKRRTPPGSK